jgi:LysM repeat protein
MVEGTIKIEIENVSVNAYNSSNELDRDINALQNGAITLHGETAKNLLKTFGYPKAGEAANLVINYVGGYTKGVYIDGKDVTEEFASLGIDITKGVVASNVGGAIGGRALAFIATKYIPGPPPVMILGTIASVATSVVYSYYQDEIDGMFIKLSSLLSRDLKQNVYITSDYYESMANYSKNEVYLNVINDDKNHCIRTYDSYLNGDLKDTVPQKVIFSVKDLLLSFDNQTKTSEIETLDEEIVKEITESILEKKDIKQISINNETYNIVKEGNLIVRNAIEHIPTVSFLLSNILIRANEILDVGEHGLYKVNSGDTMSEIAQSFGFTNALTLCA